MIDHWLYFSAMFFQSHFTESLKRRPALLHGIQKLEAITRYAFYNTYPLLGNFCKMKTVELECALYPLQALQKVAFVSQQVNVTLIVLTCYYQLHGAVLCANVKIFFFSLICFLCNDIKNKINCTHVFRTQ